MGEFFFCLLNLDIVRILSEFLNLYTFSSLVNQQGNFLSVMNRLYNSCFFRFAKIWQEKTCTITDTQTVLTGNQSSSFSPDFFFI